MKNRNAESICCFWTAIEKARPRLEVVRVHDRRSGCYARTERSRPDAKYRADRALFLMLLCAPYQSARLSDRDGTGYNRSGQSPSTS